MNLQPHHILQIRTCCKTDAAFVDLITALESSWELPDELLGKVSNYFTDVAAITRFRSIIDQVKIMSRTKAQHIMVVDDEPPVLLVVDQMLKTKNYKTTLCLDAKSCIEALKEELPDLVVLDINMPDINGAGLYSLIRQSPKMQYIPVLFQSGSINEDEAAYLNSKGIGTRKYIRKPFTCDQLIAMVEMMLNPNVA